MRYRPITGLAGTLVVVLLGVFGLGALFETIVLDPGEYVVPTVATLAIALAFLIFLVVEGANSGGGVKRAYW